MYIQEITINIKSKTDKDELVDQFNLLLSHYRGNGQTQGKIETQFIKGNKIIGLPFTLEKNSLDKQNNNFYVKRQIERIETLCNSTLQIKTIGKTHESYKGACNCTQSDFYILITNYITIQSPLTCGTCDMPVPLYRLPKYHDYGYMPILNWETNYISCDSLQMNCEVGERWALNQMQKINSQLSKQGIEICKKIEGKTSVPTFYYLHNYKKVKDNQFITFCPSCGEKWDLKEQIHEFYDFKCDKCRVISTISQNSG